MGNLNLQTTNLPNLPLDLLAKAWLEAKAAEQDAIQTRRELDAHIAALLSGKEEGTISQKLELDGIKVTVTRSMRRSVDSDLLLTAYENGLSEGARKCFKWSADLDTKQYRAIEAAAPEVLQEINRFITTKPSVPSVKVEEL